MNPSNINSDTLRAAAVLKHLQDNGNGFTLRPTDAWG
jgi:hypothetical protein